MNVFLCNAWCGVFKYVFILVCVLLTNMYNWGAVLF